MTTLTSVISHARKFGMWKVRVHVCFFYCSVIWFISYFACSWLYDAKYNHLEDHRVSAVLSVWCYENTRTSLHDGVTYPVGEGDRTSLVFFDMLPGIIVYICEWRDCCPFERIFYLDLVVCPGFDWVIDWLVGWLIDWLIDWLIGRLIDLLVNWLIDWLIGWLIDWLVDSVIDWSVDFSN